MQIRLHYDASQYWGDLTIHLTDLILRHGKRGGGSRRRKVKEATGLDYADRVVLQTRDNSRVV